MNVRTYSTPKFSLLCVFFVTKFLEMLLYSFTSHADYFISHAQIFFPVKRIPRFIIVPSQFFTFTHRFPNFVSNEKHQQTKVVS